MAVSDYFSKVNNADNINAVTTSLSEVKLTGTMSITVESLEGWATDTPIYISIYPDGDNIESSQKTEWMAEIDDVDARTVTLLRQVNTAQASDQDYQIGSIVEPRVISADKYRTTTGILKVINQDGTLNRKALYDQLKVMLQATSGETSIVFDDAALTIRFGDDTS